MVTLTSSVVSKLVIFLIPLFCCTDSYAKRSRYDLSFLEKSTLLNREFSLFQSLFADDYLVKQEVKRVKSIASSRIKDFHSGHIRETKMVLAQNPLYLIPWPNDKNLIQKYMKLIEEEKRNE